jgi:hypothetical protein
MRCSNDECDQDDYERMSVKKEKNVLHREMWLWLFVLFLEIASVPEGSLSDWSPKLSARVM